MALGQMKVSKIWLVGLLMAALVMVSASPLTADFDCEGQTSIGVDECQALVALYNGTGGESWTNSSGWLQDLDVCAWHGVACSQGHVVSLDLNSNNLSGNLPIEIGGFPYLKTLTLNDNPLTGPVPVTVTFMTLDLFHFQGTSLCEPVDPGFQDWFSQIVYRFSSGIYCSTLEPTNTAAPDASTELPWPQQTLTALAVDAQTTNSAPVFATSTPEVAPTRVSGASTQSDFYSSDFGEGMGSFGGMSETGTKPGAASKNERSGFFSNIPITWLVLLTVPVGLIVLGIILELRERRQARTPAKSDTNIDLDERLGGGEKKKDQDKGDDNDDFGDFDMYDFGGN